MANKPSPFDAIKSIKSKSPYMFDGSHENEANAFNGWLTNLAFSYNHQCIFFAQCANEMPHISNHMLYDFYFYALPKQQWFSPWEKKSSNKKTQDLARVLGVSHRVAQTYESLIDDDTVQRWADELDADRQ